MGIIRIIIMLLIGMLIVLSLPIRPEIKTLVNIVMFAVAIWRITIQVYLLMEKYPPSSAVNAED